MYLNCKKKQRDDGKSRKKNQQPSWLKLQRNKTYMKKMAGKWQSCPSLNENSKIHKIRTKCAPKLSWEVLIKNTKPPHHYDFIVHCSNILNIYVIIQKCPKINPRLFPVYFPIYWFSARRHSTVRVTPSVVSNGGNI